MTEIYDDNKQAYIDAGYWPRRKARNSKGCKDVNFTRLQPEVEQTSPYDGIMLLSGSNTGDGTTLGWIDVDDDRLTRAFRVLFAPQCERFGSKGTAIPVRVDSGVVDQAGLKIFEQTKDAVEFLFFKKVIAIPPSIHPDTKKPYAWVGKPLLEVDKEALPLVDRQLMNFMTAIVKSKHLPTILSGSGTHDAGLKYVGQMVHHTEDDKLIKRLIEALYPADYEGNELKNVDKWIKDARKKLDDGKWTPRDNDLDRSKSGKIIVCSANTRAVLDKMGVRVRYDEFADRELVTIGEEREQANRDDVEVVIRDRMDREFGYQISAQAFRDTMMAISRERTFHPVKDYLRSLKWDGTERIGSWLVDYGGADDTPYVREVSRVMLLAAVRRIMAPGSKFDQMVVIYGEQGTGKSSAIKILARNVDWFCDSLHMEAKDKELIEQTQGKWLIEMSELKGMHRSQAEHVKAMITRTHDRSRKAYGRIVEEKARHFIMVGTTNEVEFLRDETGNRRFWPVAAGRFDLGALKRDRDQIWAEAFMVEQMQVPIRMDESLWQDANAIQEKHRVRDNPYVDALRDKLSDKADGRIKTSEVLLLLGMDTGKVSNPQYKTLKSAMIELGWKYKPVMRFGNSSTTGGYIKGNGAEIIHADFGSNAEGHKKLEY